jgi:hypothetical protein
MARAFRNLRSMELSDDERFDWLDRRSEPMEPPDYPPGMCFTVRESDFGALGVEGVAPGQTVDFAALARATSVSRDMDGCRVEAEIMLLSLGDGEMVELDDMMRPCICLDEGDHERLDLDEECESGDVLHLIGVAQVKSIGDSQWGGKTMCLQIIQACVEDEDRETMGDMC